MKKKLKEFIVYRGYHARKKINKFIVCYVEPARYVVLGVLLVILLTMYCRNVYELYKLNEKPSKEVTEVLEL